MSIECASFRVSQHRLSLTHSSSKFAHLAWVQSDRKSGGVGDLAYPLVADMDHKITEAYRLATPEGPALRGLFVIDKEGVIQHSTINNLGFGRSVEETLRVLQAIQYIQARAALSRWRLLALTLRAGEPRRGLPRRMEAGRGHDEAGSEGEQGVLQVPLILWRRRRKGTESRCEGWC